MARDGWGLGAWESLVLMGLYGFTVFRAAALNSVENLSVEAQTNTSISLHWEVPMDTNPQNLTYWIQCVGDRTRSEVQSTTETTFTVDRLHPASTYECSVWTEKDGNSGPRIINGTTALNSVSNLRVDAQTNISISLRWDIPEGPQDNFVYWVQWLGDGGRDENRSTADTSITVDGLSPGTRYEFSVWVEKDGLESLREKVNGTTAPNPVRNLKVDTQTSVSISLRWEVPEGPQDSLIYWVQWLGVGGRDGNRSTADTSITVDGLSPGTQYEFSVWVEKDGVESSREKVNGTTTPNPVSNLRVDAQTSVSISLRWEVPEGPQDSLIYWVQWLGVGGRDGNRSTADTSITVDGLGSGTPYEFSVWVEKDGVESPREKANGTTVSNPVRNLRTWSQPNNSIILNWESPEGPMYPSYTYWILWVKEDNLTTRVQNTSITSISVNGLDIGSLYDFTVLVERKAVRGFTSTFSVAAAPSEVTHLLNETQTSSSITLRWNTSSDPYVQFYTYWIHWTSKEQPQKIQDPPESEDNLPVRTNETWYEVKTLKPGTWYNFSVWIEWNKLFSPIRSFHASTVPDAVHISSCVSTSRGYGVTLTWSCPSGGYQTFELQVGGYQVTEDNSSCGKSIFIQDIGPSTSYEAVVTTVWYGLKAQSIPVACYTDNTGIIAGAVGGFFLLLILVGLLVFFLKKRNKMIQPKEPPKAVFSFQGDILAKDFAEHVRRYEKDSNYGFAEEYQQLTLEEKSHSQMAASAPENVFKNRYKNVLPYDWSLVPLEPLHDKPGSDYINASFIPGLHSYREFIATQGPLPNTVGDFWRMVWEQQSCTLVMLSNCMESGRVKCELYWPVDSQPCTHGQLRVTLLGEEEVTEDWTVRELQLSHIEEQKSFFLRQFHYLSWPDHGVPFSPDPVLAFWKEFRVWLDQTMDSGPPIIHCSAGVGRTGTFIALDILLRQLLSEGHVGPFSLVKKMRDSRPMMVQTEAQYVFLHQCILKFLQQAAQGETHKEAIYKNVPSLVYENVAAI